MGSTYSQVICEVMTKAERTYLSTSGFSGGTDTRPSAVMRRLERRGLMTIEDRGPAALKRYVWRLTGAGVDARAQARMICDDCGCMAADHAIHKRIHAKDLRAGQIIATKSGLVRLDRAVPLKAGQIRLWSAATNMIAITKPDFVFEVHECP